MSSCCEKIYRYNTQADMKDLSYADILSLDPDDVSFETETQTGGFPLSADKMKALKSLLSYKRTLEETNAELITI